MKTHRDSKTHISDPLEARIASALDLAGLEYVRDGDMLPNGKRRCVLDFWVPELRTFIEVKQFYSMRADRQLAGELNVVLLQGAEAVDAFCSLLECRTMLLRGR